MGNSKTDADSGKLQIQTLPTPTGFRGVLKGYQRLGFSWLAHMFEHGLNPLLCDQMGLGKTVQVIAFFQHLFERVQAGPFLVVCPNSLLGNWVSELRRFSDSLRVWPYWGSVGQRKTIRAGFAHLVHVHDALEAGQDASQF